MNAEEALHSVVILEFILAQVINVKRFLAFSQYLLLLLSLSCFLASSGVTLRNITQRMSMSPPQHSLCIIIINLF